MINKKGLRNRNSSLFNDEDVNPMESVANLVDAMLVLACGLMMSIIMFYNVDLAGKQKEIPVEETVEVESDGIIDSEGNISSGFESKGMVYEDKETGKMYIISSEDEE